MKTGVFDKFLRGLIFVSLATLLITPALVTKFDIAGEKVDINNETHQEAIRQQIGSMTLDERHYTFGIKYFSDLNAIIQDSRINGDDGSYDKWKADEYRLSLTRAFLVKESKKNTTLLVVFIVLILLVAMDIARRQVRKTPGDRSYTYSGKITSGVPFSVQRILVFIILTGTLIYAITSGRFHWIWPILFLGLVVVISLKVGFNKGDTIKNNNPVPWLGVLLAAGLIIFYFLLYWAPWLLIPWIRIFDPVSTLLNGGPASQWFMYGFLYTVVIGVFGLRMLLKYRGDLYQQVRTWSVILFQVAFAFLIPEILIRLNQPAVDFKNIWPLNYSFFFDWNISQLIDSGNLGVFMLVWGIALIVIAVPVFTYLYGKRWYCSWVCGCGGLANTMGDAFRHLSDKRLIAWKYERWIIHGVLVFAIVMTLAVLYTFFTNSNALLGINSYSIRGWYGFFIGSVFAGVVGTGFYPLMGTRVWCRFGCPLAAYIGLIQRFKSRFRITVNGGQCISCGNCSTYCEMGIDVRAYAQKGQDIVRASCVGCGICASVCPRGVLRLENVSTDIAVRGSRERAVHIREGDVRLLA